MTIKLNLNFIIREVFIFLFTNFSTFCIWFAAVCLLTTFVNYELGYFRTNIVGFICPGATFFLFD